MNKLILSTDLNGNVTNGISLPDAGVNFSLAAAGTQSVVIPFGVTQALIYFTPGASVLYGWTAPATPSGSVAASNNFMHPQLLNVVAGLTLYFLAIDAAIINISYF